MLVNLSIPFLLWEMKPSLEWKQKQNGQLFFIYYKLSVSVIMLAHKKLKTPFPWYEHT